MKMWKIRKSNLLYFEQKIGKNWRKKKQKINFFTFLKIFYWNMFQFSWRYIFVVLPPLLSTSRCILYPFMLFYAACYQTYHPLPPNSPIMCYFLTRTQFRAFIIAIIRIQLPKLTSPFFDFLDAFQSKNLLHQQYPRITSNSSSSSKPQHQAVWLLMLQNTYNTLIAKTISVCLLFNIVFYQFFHH